MGLWSKFPSCVLSCPFLPVSFSAFFPRTFVEFRVTFSVVPGTSRGMWSVLLERLGPVVANTHGCGLIPKRVRSSKDRRALRDNVTGVWGRAFFFPGMDLREKKSDSPSDPHQLCLGAC